MLKGTGIGFQSPTVNLSKLPKLSGPRVKVELGLCRGKKLHDKRESDAERESRREIDRAMKERNH